MSDKPELTELQKTELELKKVEIAERKAKLLEQEADIEWKKTQAELGRIQLGEKRQELETRQRNKERGKAEQQKAEADIKAMQGTCNHHTGGEGGTDIRYGQGDMNRPACLGGIQFVDGTIRLRCLRCGKTWRSNMPNGSAHLPGGTYNGEFVGNWAEGIALWKNNQNKTMSVVGGIKTSPVV